MRFFYFSLSFFLFVNFNTIELAPKGLQVGDMMPSFSLIDHKGNSFDTEDYNGKQPIVVFFFKKGSPPVCDNNTKCPFRDSFHELITDLNIKIAGISADNVTTLNPYSKKNYVNYSLLSDHKKRVHKLFGFSKSFLKKSDGRVCYISDKKGKIIFVSNNHIDLQQKFSEILIKLRA